jgi:hypothetical protein
MTGGRRARVLGDLEGYALLGEGPLGSDDPLGDGRLRDQERPRDLLGLQAAEQTERERDARLGGQHRMAGREHHAQEVVLDLAVDGHVDVRLGNLPLGLELMTEHLKLARVPLLAADEIDGAMLGGGHEPGTRVAGYARLGPLLERRHQGVLCEFLGDADVAHDPDETGDHPR